NNVDISLNAEESAGESTEGELESLNSTIQMNNNGNNTFNISSTYYQTTLTEDSSISKERTSTTASSKNKITTSGSRTSKEVSSDNILSVSSTNNLENTKLDDELEDSTNIGITKENSASLITNIGTSIDPNVETDSSRISPSSSTTIDQVSDGSIGSSSSTKDMSKDST
ncbi:hypothetical protein SNEBB_011300, partial [Seison nebaliae]